jgi:hypothetical protein
LAKKKHREPLLMLAVQPEPAPPPVWTNCFFEVRLSTTTAGIVTKDAAGRYKKIDWLSTEAMMAPPGAAPCQTSKAALPVGHGDIYADRRKKKLEWEMVKKYRSKVR